MMNEEHALRILQDSRNVWIITPEERERYEHLQELSNQTNNFLYAHISPRGWLGLSSNKDIENSVHIRVWLNPNRNICSIGIVYNGKGMVNNLKNILHIVSSEQKKKLIEVMKELSDDFTTRVVKKIYKYNFSSPTEYKLINDPPFMSNKLEDKDINEIFRLTDNIIEEGEKNKIMMEMKPEYNDPRVKRRYFEYPSIDIVNCEFQLTDESFIKKLSEIYKIYEICNDIKSSSKINKEIKEENKRISSLKSDITTLINKIESGEKYPNTVSLFMMKNYKKELEQKKLELNNYKI